MKASKLKKDKMTTVRYNSEVLEKLKEMGFRSVQDLFDKKVDESLDIELIDPLLFK